MTLVVLEAVAKSECVDQLEALFKGAVPDTRAYDGCQQIRYLSTRTVEPF